MKKKSKANCQFNFQIHAEKGSILKPTRITQASSDNNFSPGKPLKYLSDALFAASLLRLFPQFQCPVTQTATKPPIPFAYWQKCDPHFHLMNSARPRVLALKNQLQSHDEKAILHFEKSFSESLANSFQLIQSQGAVNLADFWPLLDALTFLESKLSTPLMFDFALNLSPGFWQQAESLYSLLFNLRTMIALDHNAHVEDTTHEALKVDSISDYLPKADYITNDAILYYQFKKMATPFVSGRSSQVQVEKLLIEPLTHLFHRYSHNASYLIDHLPPGFLKQFQANELEQTLYLAQMDWLFGSEAGLLYRLREELFGLINGYEKIFWTERESQPSKRAVQLQIVVDLWSEEMKGAA